MLVFNIDIEFSVWITGPIKVILIPLNYLFIRKLFDVDKSSSWKDLLHFIPFVFDLILTVFVAYSHASDVVNNNQINIKEAFDTVWEGNFYFTLLSFIARSVSLLQSLFYSVVIAKLINKSISFQKMEKSQINHSYILWLRGIVFSFLIMGIFEGLAIFGVYKYPPIFFMWFVFLLFNAFYFFLFVMLFPDETNISEKVFIESPVVKAKEEVGDEWLHQFLKNEVFLDSELTLLKTSLMLKVPRYRLTQLIRDAGYANFYSFVNYYRIEKSKSLLLELSDTFVIESVIEDSGFKSRSTYFRVFKEITGLTPGEFLRKSQ
jgi:AraC-like DNA-binding protein